MYLPEPCQRGCGSARASGAVTVNLYHRTPAAAAILREGFRDATGSYGFLRTTLTGVWLASEPLDSNEGAMGDDLLQIIVPGDVDLSEFEIVGDRKGYREWCVPASLINERCTVREVSG